MNSGAASTPSSARAYVVMARDARVAVVFRRGPSKQVRMIRWDLATDELQYGQWLAGRIYEERCGLSPNGRLLVYFAGKFKTKLGTFTAVCRPPNFTALALWPDGSTYGGGGFFVDDRTLVMSYGRAIPELNGGKSIPADFRIRHRGDYAQLDADALGTLRHPNWRKVQVSSGSVADPSRRVTFEEPWIYERTNPHRPRVMLERRFIGMFETNGPLKVHEYALAIAAKGRGGPERVELGRLEWADFDQDGSLLISRAGKLHRRRLQTLEDADAEIEVADLRDQTFENILPGAEARQWPRLR